MSQARTASADRNGDLFLKPWFRELNGSAPARRRHPYPRGLFRAHEAFPLLVLDGGAFFWLHDQVGGAADGRAIIEGLASGKLLMPWTTEDALRSNPRKRRSAAAPGLDWDRPYCEHAGSPFRAPLERMVWANRLYFLLPLAAEFLRTGDERWARQWIGFFTDWHERHPRRPTKGDPRHGDFVWFDMQVCWRLLVLIHSVHLLAGSKRIAKRQWGIVYDAIEEHADHALGEAHDEVAQGTQGANHSLQRGTALLYAGVLFPELQHAAACLEAGSEIIRWQMREQILPDGGSLEGSPSYSHFIARQYVEAFGLLSKNGLTMIDGLEVCIRRQYAWMFQASSPSETSLQVGDSYALDVRQDLDIVSRIFPLELPARKISVLYEDGPFAILRNSHADLYVDAMKLREDHQHLGRPNLLLYVDGQPLLVDSGCHNYDRPIVEHYLRSAAAHNVVLVPELQEPSIDVYQHPQELRQRYSRIAVTEFRTGHGGGTVSTIATLERDGRGYTWERTVILEPERIRIMDAITSADEVLCRQLFHLAPVSVLVTDGGRSAVVQLGRREIAFEHAAGASRFSLQYLPAIDGANAPSYSPTLVSEARGKRCTFEVLIGL